MRGFNSASIDLIYLDPPFNSKADYAAPIGSVAAGAEFKDTWTLSDVNVEWINLIETKHPALYRVLLASMSDSDKSYLAYMAVRLLEMQRIIKPTGSIYLHCDPTMSHYLKLVMDAIFGRSRFQNEVIWQMKSVSGFKSQANRWIRDHDVLLFYSKSKGYRFNKYKKPYTATYIEKMFNKVDEDGRRYRQRTHKRYYADEGGVPYGTVWDDIHSFQTKANSAEITGYPTQKPLALLERIIKASSNEGDVVLDPFCGCATACIAAEDLGREWIGIDVSAKAAELVRMRMERDLSLFTTKVYHRTDVPQRTDLGKLPPYNARANKKKLYGEQGGDCTGCREHFKEHQLEVDHIIARKWGGTDHIANLQLLCSNCNRIKGDRGMDYLQMKLQLHRSRPVAVV